VKRVAKPSVANAPKYAGTVVEDQLKRPGGKLLAMLFGRAQELGHGRLEMAQYLGVTYGYIAQLTSGHRAPQNISSHVLDNCARYLGVSKLMVLIAAGIVKREDALDRPEELETALPAAMQFIARDANFGALMPQEFLDKNVPVPQLYFIVRLYEAATGRRLLSERPVDDIIHALDKVEKRRQELLAS